MCEDKSTKTLTANAYKNWTPGAESSAARLRTGSRVQNILGQSSPAKFGRDQITDQPNIIMEESFSKVSSQSYVQTLQQRRIVETNYP